MLKTKGKYRYLLGLKILKSFTIFSILFSDSDLGEISKIASTVITTTYIVIISVIAVVVVITVIVVIVVCCVCNRRRATRGNVYQNAQPMPNQVPMGAYPTTTTTPYIQAGVYPQTGYQPPPQNVGYQPAPNMEYKSDSG